MRADYVKSYFMRALRLHEAGYVSLHLLQEACSVDGINILYESLSLWSMRTIPSMIVRSSIRSELNAGGPGPKG